MASDVEIERALAAVTATLNDQGTEQWAPGRVQQLLDTALAGERRLRVDAGGGVHDETGARVSAIRRTDAGEWITERQNDSAVRSDTEIPARPPR